MLDQVIYNFIRFSHRLTKGPHAIVSGAFARRIEGEYSNSYVFPNQPLTAGETVVIYVS